MQQALRMEAGLPKRPPLLEGYLSSDEVCQKLGITRFTLAKYHKDPLIGFPPPLKIGIKSYFSRKAIGRWLKERTGDLPGE